MFLSGANCFRKRELVDDDERAGRLSTSNVVKNATEVKQLLDSDCPLSYRFFGLSLSYDTASNYHRGKFGSGQILPEVHLKNFM